MAEPQGQHKQGQTIQADFFSNTGGLNLTDSPFRIEDNQTVAGYNFDYLETGGFKKRNGHTLLTASPDTQLRALGLALHSTLTGTRTLLRWAGRKIQTLNPTTYASTDLVEDTTAANSNFSASSSTIPVKVVQFTTALSEVSWGVGGGATSIWGYNGTKITANGVPAPTAATALAFSGASNTGGFLTGNTTYAYAIAYQKASTGALGNVALDAVYSVPAGTSTNQIQVDFPTLTNADTTKYSNIFVFRSAAGGVEGFTTGDLIAIVPSSSTFFIDIIPSGGADTNVPRPGNVILDNSPLPSGTPIGIATYRRKMVTALGSTVYISDINKPESWPLTNTIQIPSGGPITAFGVISFTTPTSSNTDELLVVFKERETWVIQGDTFEDFSLNFIDVTGCLSQVSVVAANVFLFWPDYRGIDALDGASKPSYISRPIEFQFSSDGDLDRSKLKLACGAFHRKSSQVIWSFSSSTIGEQVYQIKLDLRLTLPQMNSTMMGRSLDGVFTQDESPFPIYALSSLLPTFDEKLMSGDNAGKTYANYDNGIGDAGGTWDFSVRTRPLDMGNFTGTKRFLKVIVWVRETTTKDLTLNYWVNYRIDDASKSTQSQPITRSVTNAFWDQASWDSAYWDTILKTYSPVVFNLSSSRTGTDGDALTLEFVQNDFGAPVTIAGFSVLYTEMGMRK